MKRTLAVVVAAALALGSALVAPPAAYAVGVDASGDPFAFAQNKIFIAQEVPTILYDATVNDQGVFEYAREDDTKTGTTPDDGVNFAYNSLAFNEADNFLYAAVTDPLENSTIARYTVIKIGQDAKYTVVNDDKGKPLVLPPLTAASGAVSWYNAGVFGDDGYYYLSPGAESSILKVNVNPDLGPIGVVGKKVELSGERLGPDVAAMGGYIWSLNTTSSLLRYDPVTETVVSNPIPETVLARGPYGAQFRFGNGNLGVSNNNSGLVTQFRVLNKDADNFSIREIASWEGPSSSNNDGSAIPGSPIDLSLKKSADPSVVPAAGAQVTWTLTVTNEDENLTSSGAVITDTLPAGLTGATTSDARCQVEGETVSCALGAIGPKQSKSITFTSQYQNTHACITNTGSVLGNEADPNAANNTAEATACLGALSIEKSAEIIGVDTISHTVKLTNTSDAIFDSETLASFVDDLSDVEAEGFEYNNDATTIYSAGSAAQDAKTTYAVSKLNWSGPLNARESATVTYTVTTPDGTISGDGTVHNEACTSVAHLAPTCASTDTPLPTLAITKTSDTVDLPAKGATITYTITVSNTGTGDFTDAAPAAFTDDLSKALDDGTFTEASLTATAGTATYAEPKISWSGPLKAGEEAKITYQFTFEGTGDNNVDNIACIDQTNILVDGAPCSSSSVPAADLKVTKASAPASGAEVKSGETVTYTLTFDNSAGTGRALVDYRDALAGVVDDATLSTTFPVTSADSGSLTATLAANAANLRITGVVAAGDTETITYQAVVKPYEERVDHVLLNYTFPTGEKPPATCDAGSATCTTHPVSEVAATKSVSPEDGSVVDAGDQLDYTITLQNLGGVEAAVDYTDDFTGVIDDADPVGKPVSSDPAVTVTEVRPGVVQLSGTLAVGAEVTVTYSVIVHDVDASGDDALQNFLVITGETPSPDCAVDSPTCTKNTVSDLVVRKSSDPVSGTAVKAGDVLNYTVEFDNSAGAVAAPVDYQDILVRVLDDATLTTHPSASNPELTITEVEGTGFNVDGTVAAGQIYTVSYSVTVNDVDHRGNSRLANFVVPAGVLPPSTCDDTVDACTVHPAAQLLVYKNSDPADGETVVPGQEVTYTITFDNSAGYAAADVDKTDLLAGVLDDASLVGDVTSSGPALKATLEGESIHTVGSLAAGASADVSYTVKVRPDGQRGDSSLANFVVNTGEDPPATCEPSDRNCALHPVSSVVVTKAVDPKRDTTVYADDELTYTLTFESVGTAPAAVDYRDILTGVFDDAELVGEVTSSDPALTVDPDADGITIGGTLAAKQKATVSYTVKVSPLNSRGDNSLENFVVTSGAEPPVECLADNEACTVNPAPHLVVSKAADPAEGTAVSPGSEVTYTVTLDNQLGKAAAVVDESDDLSGVLDDATLVGDPEVSSPDLRVVLEEGTLRLTGEVAARTQETVSYTVKVKENGARGDNVLGNVIVRTGDTPPAECAPDDVRCTVHPVAAIEVTKSADPEDGMKVVAGQVLTYTVTFASTGAADASVDHRDDLAGVLDDAVLTAEPVASSPALTVTSDADGFAVTGVLAPGASESVTYQVMVNPVSERGDDVLANFVVAAGTPTPKECVAEDLACTRHPAPHLIVSKSSDPEDGATVIAGQDIVYTVTFDNTQGEAPASIDETDLLVDVLDDAALVGEPTVSDLALEAVVEKDTIRTTGELPAGASASVSYTVRVAEDGKRGNDILGNFVVTTGATPPETCNPDERSCTVHPVAAVQVTKAADPARGTSVVEGQVITYTLTFGSVGAVDAGVDYRDHLEAVLDDATFLGDPTVSSPALVATADAEGVSITGVLPAGAVETVTYQVAIKPVQERGDGILNNYVTPAGGVTPPECDPKSETCTSHLVPNLVVSKSADPASGETVQPGDKVSYTVTLDNTLGTAAAAAAEIDDLSGVLDDADLVGKVTSSDPALSAVLDGQTISMTGTVDAGAVITVTYTVTVSGTGDYLLDNVLYPSGTTPPETCAADDPRCTVHPVGAIVTTKAADVADGGEVARGGLLTYTLSFDSVGTGSATVASLDDLTGVFDDAELTGEIIVSDPGLTVTKSAKGFSITGELPAGASATVAYQITVRDDGTGSGDGRLENYLLPEGSALPELCATDDRGCTVHTLPGVDPAPTDPDPLASGHDLLPENPGVLPITGVNAAPWVWIATLFLLLGAAALLSARWLRRE